MQLKFWTTVIYVIWGRKGKEVKTRTGGNFHGVTEELQELFNS